MKPNQLRPWWLRKRILLPFVLFTGLGVAGTIAFVNSDTSTIVIYNETGAPLPPLLIRACGQTRTFSTLAEQESVCLQLKPDGGLSTIHLELATQPLWQWDGGEIRPRGGERVSIRLWPSRQVEAFREVSWWRK